MSSSGNDGEILKAAVSRTPECLSLEELGKLVEGMQRPELERLQRHVASCARCRTELELLSDFAAGNVRPEEEAAVSSLTRRIRKDIARLTSSKPRSRWRSIQVPAISLVAACLLVLAGISLMRLRTDQVRLDPGAAEEAEVYRSPIVRALSPRDDIARPASQFMWEAFPQAADYELRVTEVDGNELWRTVVHGTVAAAPAALQRRMLPAKTLLWSVTARARDGSVIAVSETVPFRVARKSGN